MEIALLILKISLALFVAGNMLDLGLKLNLIEALRGLQNIRFVLYTIIWCFVVSPALAYLITVVIPLDKPIATGLILLGLAPTAPFIPIFVTKAKGDLAYTATFIFIAALGTIITMPFTVPFMIEGLSITAFEIAKPLIIMILLPWVIGMIILKLSSSVATRILPTVNLATKIFTIIAVVFLVIVYWRGVLNVLGSFAIATQCIFYLIICVLAYKLSFGLEKNQRIVISVGTTTRNVGAAMASLYSVANADEKSIVMVFLAIPIMVLFAMLSVKLFGEK